MRAHWCDACGALSRRTGASKWQDGGGLGCYRETSSRYAPTWPAPGPNGNERTVTPAKAGRQCDRRRRSREGCAATRRSREAPALFVSVRPSDLPGFCCAPFHRRPAPVSRRRCCLPHACPTWRACARAGFGAGPSRRDLGRSHARTHAKALSCRPEIGRDYPLNLSILISGGKETNKDSLSNGE